MIGTIVAVVVFIIIIAACCAGSDGSPANKTPPKRNTQVIRRNNYQNHYDYCECPSCGAPYYDGYCEECGYPDVNQGWLGEEYG